MLDLIALISMVVMFGVAVIYVRGCDRLKGSRL